MTHTSELNDPKHGVDLTISELKQFLVRPRCEIMVYSQDTNNPSDKPDANVWGPEGIIYYISNRSCNIIVNTMEKINYNIFHLDEFTNSYPYMIEDAGITYIMYYNQIHFINNKDFFDTPESIVKHTNAFK
jgi:hypothetical protein